ncbi:hypothetical protein OF83DRAFT_1179330, partial [Amylostereum chailletii]
MALFKQDYFKASDVADAPWRKINSILAEELPEDATNGWEDDDGRAARGWKETPIRFSIPLRT